MDAEVKQRNRRRKRAQRMQAQRDMTKNADSNEEDESPVREKPPRPPNRRKKSKEPLVEEDIIDGFAILGFKTYEDLETVLKIANKENVRRLVEIERPKHEPRPHITHHISAHPPHGLTLTQDPATSDDSGRASERLTGSSVAPRDADSSRDRLSDASSRCSSGKGYICDSEGDDDKGSDASSVIFGSTPGSRKHEFPGALPPSLPSLNNGTSSSPVPAPTPPDLPAPSPAPAQLPPPPPVPRHVIVEEKRPPEPMTVTPSSLPSPAPAAVAPPPVSVPNPPVAAAVAATPSIPPSMAMSMPQPAAAPVVHHPPALGSSTPGTNTSHARTESPAVATSAPGYHPPYQPLYAPYAATVHTPYSSTVAVPTTTPTAATTVTASSHPTATSGPPTPRSHSPARERERERERDRERERERESYSSVSSLSRTSVTPQSCPPPPTTTAVSSSLTNKPWTGPSSTQLSPAPRPTPPPLHSAPYPAPMFATPLPPAQTVSRASPTVAPPPTNPNPFSAESLFQQSNQADMLRRELDNRFLASQDSRGMNVAPPPPYLRTEMHQHQHHHTHVHQHTTSLLPPPPSSTMFPSPLFKEIPKLGSHESPFYRQNIGLPPSYSGYTPSLLHSGLTGPTPFAPPSHLPAFQPKPSTAEQPTKPKITKSGKWNAMHVRVAWEIYHHQHKGDKGGPGALKGDLLRPPTHLFNPSVRSNELTSFPPSLGHRPPPPTFEQPPHPGSLFTAPGSHIGNTMSFTRYGGAGPGFGAAGPGTSPFSVSAFPPSAAGRPNELPPLLHDPWRRSFPPSMPPNMPPNPWSMKPDPLLEQQQQQEREEREMERLRSIREERERREREEKRRIEKQQAEQRERERREKERREMEQRERERLLHQQRLVESAKPLQAVIRDRSPMRNGDGSEIRIKEEPRSKEEEANVLMRTATDPRYHPYLRTAPPHAMQPPPLSRVLPPAGLSHHYPPPPSHWPPPPTDPFYRYDHLRYNVMDVMRAEEERVKMFGSYHPPHPSQLRTKDPGLMHLRPGPGPGPPPTHKMCATPPTDLHKKEEPR